MKIVVIDTNVFISALNKADTPPRSVLRLCFEHRLMPLMGMALLTEYEDVLERDKLFEHCHLDKEERLQFFSDFVSLCKWTPIYYLWRPNLIDEADNHLIELAVAGNATHIITGNTKDFKRKELLFPSINIRTPRDFLNQQKEN